MPIHAEAALKRGQGSDDERRALLAGDEESEAGAEGYRGNGLLDNDEGKRPGDVKSRTNYGAAAASAPNTANARNGGADAASDGATPKAKWKRIAKSAVRVQHRAEISDALKDFDVQAFEKNRVSDYDLKTMSNKKLRAFYQQQVSFACRAGRICHCTGASLSALFRHARQNSRLNDWLEVDAVVHAMAEEILKSFEP